MQRILAKSALGVVTIVLVGCATRPEKVVAQPASADRYAAYDCQRLMREGDAASYRAQALSAALGMEVSYIDWFRRVAFRVPGIGGKAEEGELAKLKGELDALNWTWSEKGCARSVRTASDPRSDAPPLETEPAP